MSKINASGGDGRQPKNSDLGVDERIVGIDEKRGTVVLEPERWIPNCVVTLGRGQGGKSMLNRLLIECAAAARRPMRYSDADPANAGLKLTYPDAQQPRSAEPEDLQKHMRDELETFVGGDASCLFDLGAGNPTFPGIMRELNVAQFIEDYGKKLLIIFLISPSPGDLSYIESFLSHPSLAAANMVVCCNQGKGGGNHPGTAFDPYIESPSIMAALDRGARLIYLPRLATGGKVETLGLTFVDAALGRANKHGQSLGHIDGASTAAWLRELPKAFALIREWMSFAPIETLVAGMEVQLAAKVAERRIRGAVS